MELFGSRCAGGGGCESCLGSEEVVGSVGCGVGWGECGVMCVYVLLEFGVIGG